MDLQNKKNKKNKIIQHGGVATLIAATGEFVMSTVGGVFAGLYMFFINFFKVTPEDEEDVYDPFAYFPGGFWVFIRLCVKSSLYLLIFVFGGPLVTLVGIVFLYFNVYNKHIMNNEDEDEKDEEDKENSEQNQN